jgi:hypothetical protein
MAIVAGGEADAADCELSSDIVIATTAASIRQATRPAATLGPRDDGFGGGADACEVCRGRACDAAAMIAIPVDFAASSFSERESICDLDHAGLAMH